MEMSYNDLIKENTALRNEVIRLREQLELANLRLFGIRSEATEKIYEQSPGLFDELELFTTNQTTQNESSEESTTVVKEYTRKKARKPIPEHLPREEEVIELPENERVCRCGNILKEFGAIISERIEVIPASYYVKKTIRKKYVCTCCSKNPDAEKTTIKTAAPQPEFLPKIRFGYSMLAYLIASKFIDGIPFYRQNKILARYGCEISRGMMSRYGIEVSERLKDLYDQMKNDLLSCNIVGIDETRLKVLKEPDRSSTCHSYMWVFRGVTPEKKILYFEYNPSRSASVPFNILSGYKGVIQSDGYGGYNRLGKRPGIEHAGCWVHVRRKFKEVIDASKDAKAALMIFNKINILYSIEHEIAEKMLTGKAIVEYRQEKAKPVIDTIEVWLAKKLDFIPPKGLLGKAAHYMNHQFERLKLYLDYPELTPDNNLVENAIRPFVIGRKNWLFSGSPRGAQSSSVLYSLIETANANGLEPYWYLRYLFEMFPYAKTLEEKIGLLPYNLDRNKFTDFKVDRCRF